MAEKQDFPHNKDAEASVLAACMLSEEWAKGALGQLTKDHFFDLRNQSIFVAMKSLVAKGRPCDQITVREYLRSKDSKVTDSDILNLSENTFSKTCCNSHLEIIKKCELQRRLIRFAYELKAMAETSQEDIEAVREKTVKLLLPLLTEEESSNERLSFQGQEGC